MPLATTFARASLALTAALCLFVAAQRAGSLVGAGWQGYQRLHGSTFEQLRRLQYGDCGERGYGYVTRMLEGLPDPNRMPRVRYSDYDHYLRVLLQHVRPELDDRILIGIGVAERLFHEERIATARPSDGAEPPAGRWRFVTLWDYDLMTGAVVELERPLPRPVRFDLVLRHSQFGPAAGVSSTDRSPLRPGSGQDWSLGAAKSDRPLAHWSVDIPANAGPLLPLRLDRPLEHFSVGRGETDFLLDIAVSDPGAAAIAAVSAVGVRVDTRGYSIVRRDGECFLALRTDLLDEIQSTPNHPWHHWLEQVGHGDY